MPKKRNNKPRMALVPQNPMACELCLMLASRKPSYTYEFNPHGHLNHNCKCKFMVVDDKTRIEGHDNNEYYRRWQNVKKLRAKLGVSEQKLYETMESMGIKDPLDIDVEDFVESALNRENKAERKISAAKEALRRSSYKTEEAKSIIADKALGEKINSGVIGKIADCLEDAASSEDSVRKSLAKAVAGRIDGKRIVIDNDAEKSYFSPELFEVLLNAKGKKSHRTVFHEFFHMFDFDSDATYTVRKIGKDAVEEREFVTTGNYTTILFGKDGAEKTFAGRFKANSKGVTPSWRDLKKRIGAKSDEDAQMLVIKLLKEKGLSYEECDSLSDILHASSNGVVRLNVGHFDGYWKDSTRPIEFFADYGASAITNKEEFELIRHLFPDESEMLDGIVRNAIK